MAGTTGVYPCYENQFQIDKAAAEGPASYVNIADCETFGVSILIRQLSEVTLWSPTARNTSPFWFIGINPQEIQKRQPQPYLRL